MDSNNRGAGRTVTCSAPEKLDCVLPGLLAVGAVWVLCGACGRVQVILCYGLLFLIPIIFFYLHVSVRPKLN